MLSPTAPAPRTPLQNNPTLLITIWASACCIAILLFRLVSRYVRINRLYTDDKVAAWTILPLLLRTVAAYGILKFGDQNIDLLQLREEFGGAGEWEEEVRRRKWGSRCVLAARAGYVVYVGMQKACVVEFYERLTRCLWERFWERGIWALRVVVVCAGVAALVSGVAECRPTRKYWQVYPDPGPVCRQAYAQLFTFHAGTVLVDVLLLIAPIYPILRSTFSATKKFRLITTFSLGIFAILMAVARVYMVVHKNGQQQTRTLMASLDCLLVTVVANAVIVNGFVNDRGERRGSRPGPGGVPVRIEDEALNVRMCA